MDHDPSRKPNLAQVATFLRERYGPDAQEVAPLGAGEWSTAFAFRHAGRGLVVRFGAIHDDFDRDALAGHYAGPDLPIPRVLEIERAFGGWFAVSERMHGTYLDDLDGEQMRALLPPLFATLDAMRRVDLAGTAGYGNWNAEGVAPFASWRAMLLDLEHNRPGERTHGWRARLAQSPFAADVFVRSLDALRTLSAACPEERSLIHSDLLNRNVLVADGKISAVFDWGCALYGDFLYDLAWFVFWQPWYPAWQSIDFVAEAQRHYAVIGLTVPEFDTRLRCCLFHIGLSSLAYNAFKADVDPARWAELERVAGWLDEAVSRKP